MRRTIDEAVLALRQRIDGWAIGKVRPEIAVFVYPPEWEAAMLARFPQLAADLAQLGRPVDIVDVGAAFLREIERRPGLPERLTSLEQQDRRALLHDLGEFARRALLTQLHAPVTPPTTCRLLINTGALATLISYSAIINERYNEVTTSTVLAFPGEGDERSLNLLGLRDDTNYRVPRI